MDIASNWDQVPNLRAHWMHCEFILQMLLSHFSICTESLPLLTLGRRLGSRPANQKLPSPKKDDLGLSRSSTVYLAWFSLDFSSNPILQTLWSQELHSSPPGQHASPDKKASGLFQSLLHTRLPLEHRSALLCQVQQVWQTAPFTTFQIQQGVEKTPPKGSLG